MAPWSRLLHPHLTVMAMRSSEAPQCILSRDVGSEPLTCLFQLLPNPNLRVWGFLLRAGNRSESPERHGDSIIYFQNIPLSEQELPRMYLWDQILHWRKYCLGIGTSCPVNSCANLYWCVSGHHTWPILRCNVYFCFNPLFRLRICLEESTYFQQYQKRAHRTRNVKHSWKGGKKNSELPSVYPWAQMVSFGDHYLHIHF